MNAHFLFIFFVSLVFFSACENSEENNYRLTIGKNSQKIHMNDTLTLSVSTKKHQAIDSVQYYFAGKFLQSTVENNPVKVRLKKPLGRRKISAKVFKEGESTSLEKKFVLHTDFKPVVYTYKVIQSFPHDPKAFTQGLEFYKDTLYEGTGQHGFSTLRKIDLKTGALIKELSLDRKYFGEGISILDHKIYQLTWKKEIGFVYDLNSFEKLQTFEYGQSKEGWGLCNNGEMLFKSDGTNKIWILDPETLEEQNYIEPVTHKSLATKVNELEWVKGKIYANTWQKEGVLIIDPETGAVEGVIDFRGLKSQLGNTEEANVLNGIAYNKNTDKLYVTGKYWDKIFEVELVKK